METFNTIKGKKVSHCLNRLMERFGLSISQVKYQEIVKDIVDYNNKPIFVSSTDGRSFHIVEIDGCKCVFLYDWEYDCLQTVYRLKWFKKTNGANYRILTKYPKSKDIRKKNKIDAFANKVYN